MVAQVVPQEKGVGPGVAGPAALATPAGSTGWMGLPDPTAGPEAMARRVLSRFLSIQQLSRSNPYWSYRTTAAPGGKGLRPRLRSNQLRLCGEVVWAPAEHKPHCRRRRDYLMLTCRLCISAAVCRGSDPDGHVAETGRQGEHSGEHLVDIEGEEVETSPPPGLHPNNEPDIQREHKFAEGLRKPQRERRR
jgi:hypothetical protein